MKTEYSHLADLNVRSKLRQKSNDFAQKFQYELTKAAKARAQKVLEKLPMLGAVSWLMMQQSAVRHTLVSELDWRVMPALVLEQSKIYTRDGAPIAYVSWAKLSEAVAMRFRQSPHQLMSSDWQSGDQVWLVDLVAPFGGVKDVLSDLQDNVLPGVAISRLVPDGAGVVNAHLLPV